MNLIHHVLDIQAPPETVFTSITTADGLSPWWTTKVQADSAELGSLFLLTFRGPCNPQLRISEIESPSRVTWEGVSGTGTCWGSAGTIKRPVEGELLATVPRNWRRRCERKVCPRERASGSGSLRSSAGPAEDRPRSWRYCSAGNCSRAWRSIGSARSGSSSSGKYSS